MAKDYNQRKDQTGTILAEKSKRGRDIGPLPPIVDAARKEACRFDFRLFCETYHAGVFALEWSDDHLSAIAKIEAAVLHGDCFAFAFPRGSGKTSLMIAAAEWALLYGHRSFIVLIGASEDAAAELLDNIYSDFDTNDLLLEDFPEVCYPIRRLEGIANRSSGQLLDGERTSIVMTAKQLTLPTVKAGLASGSIVRVAGITGRIRGMSVMKPSTGEKIRPDFVLIDDPQTDESAKSVRQIQKRMSVINGTILGLAGPKKKISAFAAVTVIDRGDVADQLLDQKVNPVWQGVRNKLMRAMPTNTKLWEEYAEIRAKGLCDGDGYGPATKFYLANRAEMDAGADAAWPARFNADEGSAVQHAMNLKLRDEASFMAEYQNDPLKLEAESALILTADQIAAKAVKTYRRGVIPEGSVKVTSFIDVQGSVLFYVVVAWKNDFTGTVIDYGTYPEQPMNYFGLRDIKKTLARAKPGVGLEGQIYDGLDQLTTMLLSKKWGTESGGVKNIDRLLIDANWGTSTSTVKLFCKQSPFSALIIPSHGVGITADKKPMNDYEKRKGERTGWNWIVGKEGHIRYDTNSFKTFVAQRLASALGEIGTLTLFSGSATQHRLFCEHGASEYPVATEGFGRVVNVWHLRPNRENHLWDCLVGAAVAASEQGICFVGHQPATGNKTRKRKKLNVKF